MRLSDKGIQFLKQREGEVLHVYKDSRGLWTVGVGHLLTAEDKKLWTLGSKITQDESTKLLRSDLESREQFLTALIKVPVTQNQFDAMLSLLFNIGNKAFAGSTLLKRLNAGDYAGAADAFMSWTKAGSDKNILRPRRELERKLFLTK